MAETYTWKEEVKKRHDSQTVKRILPTGKNYQRMMEWYHINCAEEHNPVKEAFSLQFQWLAASPVALAEKTSQWIMKAKRSFNIFLCPETPFNPKYDAFRDWKQFSITWKDYKGQIIGPLNFQRG